LTRPTLEISFKDPRTGRLQTSCDPIVVDDYVSSKVSDEGRLTAAFRVGRTGRCFQTEHEIATPPGDYYIHTPERALPSALRCRHQ
jgi:hypothetical protein